MKQLVIDVPYTETGANDRIHFASNQYGPDMPSKISHVLLPRSAMGKRLKLKHYNYAIATGSTMTDLSATTGYFLLDIKFGGQRLNDSTTAYHTYDAAGNGTLVYLDDKIALPFTTTQTNMSSNCWASFGIPQNSGGVDMDIALYAPPGISVSNGASSVSHAFTRLTLWFDVEE